MSVHPITTRDTPKVGNGIRRIARDELIYESGRAGIPWRVVTGIVRLDCAEPREKEFAGLALKGDLLGSETLLFERYLFSATALTPCQIEPWLPPQGDVTQRSLLERLLNVERRAADLVALRSGQPCERVRRLVRLIADEAQGGITRIELPRQRDIADMTNLAAETISRAFTKLHEEGVMRRAGNQQFDVSLKRLSMSSGHAEDARL
jgi:CRP/FNR family nitrogen fixation transcriptional regulator